MWEKTIKRHGRAERPVNLFRHAAAKFCKTRFLSLRTLRQHCQHYMYTSFVLILKTTSVYRYLSFLLYFLICKRTKLYAYLKWIILSHFAWDVRKLDHKNSWQLAPKWSGDSSSNWNVFFFPCWTESFTNTCMKAHFWNDGVSACLQLWRIHLLMFLTKAWDGRVQIIRSIGRRGVKRIGCCRRWLC